MAVKFLESFDRYAAAASTPSGNTGWSAWNFGSVNAGSAGNSRNGSTQAGVTQYLTTRDAAWLANYTCTLANDATWILGAAMYRPVSDMTFLYMRGDTSSITHVQFRIKTDGSIEAKNGDGTVLGTSAPGVWVAGWHYIEAKVLLDNAAGTVDVRLDGISVLSLTGKDTRNGGTNAFFDGFTWWPDSESGGRLDDLYLVNQAAGSGGTTFLGDIIVEAHPVDGAGNYTNWTPSAGSNFQCVDERPGNNGDTDYVSKSTTGKDSYTTENTFAASGSVKAVQITAVARKDAAGDAKGIKLFARHSTTDSALSAEHILGTSYTFYQYLLEDCPGQTGWTRAQFDAAEIGVDLTTVV